MLVFIDDLSRRAANRVQLTGGSHRAYLKRLKALSAAMLTSPDSAKDRHSPRRMHWRTERDHRKQSQARQHVICRAAEPHHAHAHAPLYPPNQWLIKKGEAHANAVAPHFIYYNFARTHKTLRYSCDGRWRDRQALGDRRHRCTGRSEGSREPASCGLYEKGRLSTPSPRQG